MASCCYPPTPLLPLFLGGQSLSPSTFPSVASSPAVTTPLLPPFLVQRAPLWQREVLCALASGGPSFPTALCSGGHAPSLAWVAIGCPGHVRPAPPPWELVSQRCGRAAGVPCSVRAVPKSTRGSAVQETASELGVGPSATGSVFPPVWIHPRYEAGIPRKRLLSGRFWGSSHILKAAVRGASGVGGPRHPSGPALCADSGQGRSWSSHLEPRCGCTCRYMSLQLCSS